jgi:hypothetical protein
MRRREQLRRGFVQRFDPGTVGHEQFSLAVAVSL